MNLPSFSVSLAFRRPGVRWILALLVAGAALLMPNLGSAQTNAPGGPVRIPGVNLAGWGQVDEVQGHFSRPASPMPKIPAVLILHGTLGVDGRGAFYAKALNEAGIGTLEITMFPPSNPPRAGFKETMPHAAAALKWLAAQPAIDSQRLGVMGFSWGGVMSVLLSSELVQQRLGQDVPRPIAFAPFYPVCSLLAGRILVNPQSVFYNAHLRGCVGRPCLSRWAPATISKKAHVHATRWSPCGPQQRVSIRPCAISRAPRMASIRSSQARPFTPSYPTLVLAAW